MNIVSLGTDTLLSHLWRGGAWAYWWTPDGHEGRKESLWFPLNRRWPAVPAAWQGRNVYFPVHPATTFGARWQRTTNETVAAVNVLFAEFDAEDYGGKEGIWGHLDDLPLYPTCVIDSGGGLHCYWLLEYPKLITAENRDFLRRCQAAWVDLMGGDDGAKDLARVLRLPGYQNRKQKYCPDFRIVEIVEFNPYRLFELSQLQKLVTKRMAQAEAKERLCRQQDAERSGEVNSGAAEMLLSWTVRHAHAGSRHYMALWLAGRLKAEGLAQWAASSVLREFARQVSIAGTRQIDAKEMDMVINYVWNAQ